MTEEQKILGLIPAKSLGCLDSEDNQILQSYIEQESSFPWNELGKYQQIAALLPLSLQMEVPDPQLKDNVALKLIKITEDLRAKELQEEQERLALQKAQEEEQRAKELQEEEERLALQKAQEEAEQRAKELEEEERLAREYEEEQERLALQKEQEEELARFSEDNLQPEEQLEESQQVDESENVPPFNLDDIDLPETDSPEPFSLTESTDEEQSYDEKESEEPSVDPELPEEAFNPADAETTEDQLSEQLNEEPQVEETRPEDLASLESVVQDTIVDMGTASEDEKLDNDIESKDFKSETNLKNEFSSEEETVSVPPAALPAEVPEESEEKSTKRIGGDKNKFAEFQEEKKKTIEEKMYRALEVDLEEAISSFNRAEKKVTRNLLFTYIAIAVLLALLIFSFFKFTADIKSLENEIKKNSTSQLIGNRNIDTNHFFLS
jgi:hypothetical protein